MYLRGGKAKFYSKLFWWGTRERNQGSLGFISGQTRALLYTITCHTYHSFLPLFFRQSLPSYKTFLYFVSILTIFSDRIHYVYRQGYPIPQHLSGSQDTTSDLTRALIALNLSDDFHVLLELQPFQPTYLKHASILTFISNESVPISPAVTMSGTTTASAPQSSNTDCAVDDHGNPVPGSQQLLCLVANPFTNSVKLHVLHRAQ